MRLRKRFTRRAIHERALQCTIRAYWHEVDAGKIDQPRHQRRAHAGAALRLRTIAATIEAGR